MTTLPFVGSDYLNSLAVCCTRVAIYPTSAPHLAARL